MDPKAFVHDDWTKIWAGGWSLLTCTHFADQYTKEFRFGDRPFIRESVIFVERGKSEGWARQSDRDALGAVLAAEIRGNASRPEEICATLKANGDAMTAFINECGEKVIDANAYAAFWSLIAAYYVPHINVKYIVDYLEPDVLEEHLPKFQEARLYVEHVLDHIEEFMRTFGAQVERDTGLPANLALCMNKEEALAYLASGVLPSRETLLARDAKTAVLSDESVSGLAVGAEVKAVRDAVVPPTAEGSVKGTTGYGGTATGPVKIILDPEKAEHFARGDILVTGSTRPEYLPIMEKAAAFVTDAGGILSHAAITAREMKKPCVIGTKVATQTFKDGDVIEVNADTGVVRKI